MSELSCDTPFIGQNGTDDLSLYEYLLSLGNESDRAYQDSRLRSQKGGVEFINFPNVSFRSEINYALSSC